MLISASTESDTGSGVKNSLVPREDVFVVTKLWYEDHGQERAAAAFNQSLTK